MKLKPEQVDSLRRSFGDGDELAIVNLLLDFLDKHRETNHISLQLIRQLLTDAESGKKDRVILRALQFLAGDSIRILEIRFEIYGPDEAAHDITDEEAQVALQEHIDPFTGEQDPLIAQRLGMYFAPFAKLQK